MSDRWPFLRCVVVASALFCAASEAPAHADMIGHPMCADFGKGLSIVTTSPLQARDGGLSHAIIVATGPMSEAYMRGLRAITAPPQTADMETIHAFQSSVEQMASAMQVVYQRGRIAQVDDHGQVVCGGLPPGTYDLIAQSFPAPSGGTGSSRARAFWIRFQAGPVAANSHAILKLANWTELRAQ